MKTDDLIVRVAPKQWHSDSIVRWDPEAYILSATFSGATAAAEVHNPQQQQIESSTGIVHRGYVIMAGPLEISLDPDGAIMSLELRINPEQWVRADIPEPFHDLPDVSVKFLVEYDDNGYASVLVPVTVVWDKPHSRLSLLLGHANDVGQWYRLGTNAAIGVTKNCALREIRTFEVDLPVT
jgi:hypothetical protein